MEFTREPGEQFWSGVVEHGDVMPYAPGGSFNTRTSVVDNQVSPLLLSSRGRYLWGDGDIAVAIDEDGVRVEDGAGTAQLARGGTSLREGYLALSAQHFPASGIAPPDAMFTAPQWNTWIELVYDQRQSRILEYAQAIVDHGYPPGVLMIDDNWQEDYGVWEFHPTRFTAPKSMVDRLHEWGFKVMLWVCPFVSPDSATCREAERRGLLLRQEDGTTAIRRWWNGLSAVLDLTNPAAVAWFHERLESLQERFGIDGFKFDAGDQRFYRATDLSVTGADPNGHCASYATFAEAYAFNELRSGWKSGGRALEQRLTDALPIWGVDGLSSLLPRGLVHGLCGYAYSCPDMVGGGMASSFEKPGFQLDEELFVRWTQASALFPILQFSLAPWRALSPKGALLCRAAVDIRQRFVPLVLELARNAAATGEPIMRHLEYVFPQQGFHDVTDQFLLGDELLVAPVLHQGARERQVVFPPGVWLGDDGSTVQGPTSALVSAPLDRLPHYRRQR